MLFHCYWLQYSLRLRKHTFITSTWKEVLKFVTCLQIFLFLNNESLFQNSECSFLRMVGVRLRGFVKLVTFCQSRKLMNPHGIQRSKNLSFRKHGHMSFKWLASIFSYTFSLALWYGLSPLCYCFWNFKKD